MQNLQDKWLHIVELTKQSLSETESRTLAKTSVLYIVRWLSENIAANENESVKIAALLKLYKTIRHHDHVISPQESREFLPFADELIKRLEQRQH
ncbi:MAG: hypothetical protein K0R51_434 [Cytophagaceae bacterium]|jgi:hypothetical protein|nr:hypothetical protein [Cytophagaceae bacterium]